MLENIRSPFHIELPQNEAMSPSSPSKRKMSVQHLEKMEEDMVDDMLRRKMTLKRRSNNELPEAAPRIIIDTDAIDNGDTANQPFNASS